jgi:hypothetical protein
MGAGKLPGLGKPIPGWEAFPVIRPPDPGFVSRPAGQRPAGEKEAAKASQPGTEVPEWEAFAALRAENPFPILNFRVLALARLLNSL